ncbi:hypothetical protein SeMB42_g00428 [Synchytrium endobioticum]|uniref:Longin domain-containing protein n=1 Tax=Synchytrium endobioticum TaxID=286115 RepID=A0A507DR60_9FUNG|nr:hypothetical protein SeLEV6574_g01129 [Synchytrium endobioticum]TPX54183.1 hypothetical protein SeMB42_g00428 [Synchytrium endobioticum]
MKVYCLAVAHQTGQKATVLAAEYELSQFSFFERGSVKEFMAFFTVTVADRTAPGTRQKIQEQNYLGHVYVRQDGLAGVIVTDAEYPQRVAFSALNKLLDEFSTKFPSEARWGVLNPSNTATLYPELKQHLDKFQDPQGADPFLKVQKELDETKIILNKTMEQLLQRGEKLDDLVAKSDQLSAQSKMFYKTAKKTNACCY